MSRDTTPSRRRSDEESRGFEPLGYKTVVFRYIKQSRRLWGLYMDSCDVDHKVWIPDGMKMIDLEKEIRQNFSKDIVSSDRLVIYARCYSMVSNQYLRAHIVDDVRKLEDKELYEIDFQA